MAIATTSPLELRAASLFDIDPELGELLDGRQLTEARSRAILPAADLPAGRWSPEGLERATARPFALMVVEGLVLREMLLAGSTATELLGPGDIVGCNPRDDALLPTEVRWSVPETARVAVLDDRLLAMLRAWPSIGRVLLDRAAQRELRLATHRAIAQLPRVDQRLLAYFGHLAERWGRVTAVGVVIPLHLTHETLGRLIGARRPTVSLALKDLGSGNLLERRGDGSWLLHYEAFQELGAETSIPSGWQPADARRANHAPIAPGTPPEDAAREAPPTAPPTSPQDVQALRERIIALRRRHAAQTSRSAALIEYSRALRVARDGRDDRAA